MRGCCRCCTEVVLLLSLVGSCLLLALATARPGVPLVKAVLMVPVTFKPFVNQGSRLGVDTEWSLQTVSIHNEIVKTFDKDVSITQLADWASVHGLDIEAPLFAQAIQTIQNAMLVFLVSFTIAGYAFGLAILLILFTLLIGNKRWCHKKNEIPTLATPLLIRPGLAASSDNSAGWQSSSMTRPEHHPSVSGARGSTHIDNIRWPLPQISEEASASSSHRSQPVVVYGLSTKESLSNMTYRLALVITLLMCFGLAVIVATHAGDIRANVNQFLPALVKRLSLICLTHHSDECQLLYNPTDFAYYLLGCITVVSLFSGIAIVGQVS